MSLHGRVNAKRRNNKAPLRACLEALEPRQLLSGDPILDQQPDLSGNEPGITTAPLIDEAFLLSTTTTLEASTVTVTAEDTVTLTAKVTARDGSTPVGSIAFYQSPCKPGSVLWGMPPGTTQFFNGVHLRDYPDLAQRTFVGRVPLNADGTASLTVPTKALERVWVQDSGPTLISTADKQGPGVIESSDGTKSLSTGLHSMMAVYEAGDVLASAAVRTLSVQIQPQLKMTSVGPATRTHPPTLLAQLVSESGQPYGPIPMIDIGGSTQTATAKLSASVPKPAPPPRYGSNIIGLSFGSGAFLSASSGSHDLPDLFWSESGYANVGGSGHLIRYTEPVPTGHYEDHTPIPTGQVTFREGGGILGIGTLIAGSLVFAPDTRLELGKHTITAEYEGDANFAPASQTVEVTVTLGKTVTTLAADRATVRQGEAFELTATVSTTEKDYVAPRGTVTIAEKGKVLATLWLGDDREETLDLAPGRHRLRVAYAGDDNFLASKSREIVLDVLPKIKTATAIVLKTWGPATKKHPPTFTATIVTPKGELFGRNWPSPDIHAATFQTGTSLSIESLFKRDSDPPPPDEPNDALPTAWTYFYDEAGNLIAEVPDYYSPPGSIVHVYPGTPTPTTHQDWNLTRPQLVQNTASSPTPPPPPVPSGQVIFLDGKKVIGLADLDADGTATFKPEKLGVGRHKIRAVYVGDAEFAATKSATGQIRVTQKAQTTISFGTDTTTVPADARMSMTVIVSTSGDSAVTPTGWVSFRKGKREVARAKLDSDVLLRLKPGEHKITAVYLGDKKFDPSQSTILTLTVR